MREKNVLLGLAVLSCAFIVAGWLFAQRLGIEADEAMVANGIYPHGVLVYTWKFGSSRVPVMLISYLGALKTWLYNPYFALWKPGALSLRLPTVLAGAATLWLFFALLDSIAGRLAAWIGALLLATDVIFLLMETTDFGFVALQFLLKLSAILLLVRFHRGASQWTLAATFFLFGLAMWDKAVFIWVLFGLTAAVLLVYPRAVLRRVTRRNLAVAMASMLLGALLLVMYNAGRPLETFRANAKLANEPIVKKADILLRTVDGYALFGFMTAAQPPFPRSPHNAVESLSSRLSGWLHAPHHNLVAPALVAALAIALLTRRPRKLVLFAFLTCAFTWLPMALTARAGTGTQHTILLWPWHLLAIAAALAQLPVRWAAAATALLAVANLAVANQYYAELVRNGPAIRFTDAINPLREYLSASGAKQIFIADWGFFEPLNLLSEGELPSYFAFVRDPAELDRIVTEPRHLFVAHTPTFTFQPELRSQFDDRARAHGLHENPVKIIFDRNGRSTFEVFRFQGGG